MGNPENGKVHCSVFFHNVDLKPNLPLSEQSSDYTEVNSMR